MDKQSTIPSPEVKEMMKRFVQIQKEKYGENWKEVLAKEMTAQIPKFLIDAISNSTPK